MHETSLVVWIAFVAFILLLLLLDLGVFHKKSHTVGFKESIIWSGVWIALAMAFNVIILFWRGENDFMLFLTGYVIEKSLSVDNLFVFLLIFSFFKVPNQYQHKVLFYGILGALIMRALFIWGGIAILTKFTWVVYLFGAFLIFSGVKMLMPQGEDHDLEKSWVVQWTKKIFPTTPHFVDDKFFHRVNGVLHVTPLFITLIFVEFSDLVFAIDSIPAIIGITSDPFLVFTSNVFAILGLRSLYFALKGFADIFHYLKYGLSIILMFIGAKMILLYWDFHMPVPVTMAVIFVVLMASVIASLISNRNKKKRELQV
jgi:tellurite resistance protein TerC